jgi:hypothetical protein
MKRTFKFTFKGLLFLFRPADKLLMGTDRFIENHFVDILKDGQK